MQASQTDADTDRRGEHRRRALMTGKIVHSGGRGSFDCTLRDISDHGAQVSFADGQRCPDESYLIVVRTGQAHATHVAWRRGDRVGLKFDGSVDLSNGAPGGPPGLRNLWLELSPR